MLKNALSDKGLLQETFDSDLDCILKGGHDSGSLTEADISKAFLRITSENLQTFQNASNQCFGVNSDAVGALKNWNRIQSIHTLKVHC